MYASRQLNVDHPTIATACPLKRVNKFQTNTFVSTLRATLVNDYQLININVDKAHNFYILGRCERPKRVQLDLSKFTIRTWRASIFADCILWPQYFRAVVTYALK